MNYNLTLLHNVTGVGQLVGVANDYADGMLVGLFLLSLWFIGLLAFKRYGFVEGLVVASWVCFLISLPLIYAGWLNLFFVFFYLIIASLGSLYMWASGSLG